MLEFRTGLCLIIMFFLGACSNPDQQKEMQRQQDIFNQNMNQYKLFRKLQYQIWANEQKIHIYDSLYYIDQKESP
jgi:lipopolysaccharide export LptBFGC system permease protein LptF